MLINVGVKCLGLHIEELFFPEGENIGFHDMSGACRKMG
jgi:hypothetical protein